MKTKHVIYVSLWLLLSAAAIGQAEEPDVNGVFGLAPVPEAAALAVWVPLAGDESIGGIKWYNNDGSKAFAQLLAVAGDADSPFLLDDVVVVGEDVAGVTLGWSEYQFQPALASATTGLYLVFRLPEDGAFVAEGVGCGLGYQLGDGRIRCWVATDEGGWDPLSPEFQMAVEVLPNMDKSGEVMVLGKGGRRSPAPDEDAQPTTPLIAGFKASPNPFNPQTEIRFTLPHAGEVRLTVFDLRGREVQTLVSGVMSAGEHAVTWHGRDAGGLAQPSGVYLALLEAGPLRLTQRLTLVQ